MVRFEENKLIIEVECNTSPVEMWQDMHREFIEMLQALSPDMRGDNNYYYMLKLLGSMIPNVKQKNQCLLDD